LGLLPASGRLGSNQRSPTCKCAVVPHVGGAGRRPGPPRQDGLDGWAAAGGPGRWSARLARRWPQAGSQPTHRHASEAFTASVYQHALSGLDREAAGTIAALFVDLVAETDTVTDSDAESTTPDEARCGSV